MATKDTMSCNWATLPDIIIVNIFSFLNHNDRVSASLVCRNWTTAFHAPQLWRSMKVHFYGNVYSEIKSIQFAQRYGAYIRYLEICYQRPCFIGRKALHRHLTMFFQKLHGHTQLLKLSMQNTNFYREWKPDNVRNKLITSIVRFFKTQQWLHTLDLTNTDINCVDGIRLLDAISSHSGATLQHLLIKDFFYPRQAIFRHGRYLSVLKRFKNLQTLVMNINCLSDEIVNALAENCTGKLRFMHVKCRRNDTNYQVISSNAWKKMKVFCPELIVSFSIEQITELSTLHRLLPPEIPLQSLSYWSGYLTEEDVPWEPGEFINYVQNTFPSSLHKILMEFEDYIPLLDVALETMVINCKKLVSMDVTAVLPITFVDTLCRLRLNNQIGLHHLNIVFCGTGLAEAEALDAILNVYDTPLSLKGVDFHFSLDWN